MQASPTGFANTTQHSTDSCASAALSLLFDTMEAVCYIRWKVTANPAADTSPAHPTIEKSALVGPEPPKVSV